MRPEVKLVLLMAAALVLLALGTFATKGGTA